MRRWHRQFKGVTTLLCSKIGWEDAAIAAASSLEPPSTGFARLLRSRTATSAVLGRVLDSVDETLHDFEGSSFWTKSPRDLSSSSSSTSRTTTEEANKEGGQEEPQNSVHIEETLDLGDLKQEYRGGESVLTLPEDLEELERYNPMLRQAEEMHREALRQKSFSLKDHLISLLHDAHGKTANITKTSLNKLRVDQLRTSLERIDGDTRGNKPKLIVSLLDAVAAEENLARATEMFVSKLRPGDFARYDVKEFSRAAEAKKANPIDEREFMRMQELTINAEPMFSRVFDSPHDLAMILADAHADDIAIIDVRGRCSFTDHMVVASARSSQHALRVAGAVLHEVKSRCKEVAPGVAPVIEGNEDPEPKWMVVDAGSVLVHIFLEEARREYDLEGLWGDEGNIARVARPQSRTYTLDTLKV